MHSRVLKEIRHVKGSQIPDNQSVISHSRSSASYQFNHVKFSKPFQPKDNVNKNPFYLESVLKAKSKLKQHNTQNGLKKTSRQNSLSSLLEKEPIDSTLKTKSNRKLQHSLKRFLQNIRKFHNQMKQLAKGMLATFEKIKEQMETNLVKVADQMIKFNGDHGSQSAIHEILHNGFEAITKATVQPLESLSELKGLSEVSLGQYKQKQEIRRNTFRQPPLTPLIKANNEQRRNTEIIYGSAFSSQLISPKYQFKIQRLDLESKRKSKSRAQTERKKGESSGDRRNQPQQATQRMINAGKESVTRRSTESTHNIDCIISQMREILNE